LVKTRVEYAHENITVYPAPCPFKCKYCWSQDPIWQWRTRTDDYYVEKEARRLAGARKPRIIVVSFTTDPYQPIEQKKKLTRQVLSILLHNGDHQILILTKNPQFAVNRDLDLLKQDNVWLGTTLTATFPLDDEPYASDNIDRANALREAHLKGVNTWVSIEPWIPEKTYPRDIIQFTHKFVDWYVIGRLNYETRYGYPKIPTDYYADELVKVVGLLADLGFSPSQFPRKKGFWIKKELKGKAG